MAAASYRITDAWADPPGCTEHLHSERLLRLPWGVSCWKPPEDTPEPGPPPAGERGFVCFGSFNYAAKLTDQVVEVWARILRRVDGPRLLLKHIGLGDEGTQEIFRRRFGRWGAPECPQLLGATKSRRQHLALYGELNMALDPFPYNGTTTTCEALLNGRSRGGAGGTHASLPGGREPGAQRGVGGIPRRQPPGSMSSWPCGWPATGPRGRAGAASCGIG